MTSSPQNFGILDKKLEDIKRFSTALIKIRKLVVTD